MAREKYGLKQGQMIAGFGQSLGQFSAPLVTVVDLDGYRTLKLLAHELAHTATAAHATGHGPEFRANHIAIVEKLLRE